MASPKTRLFCPRCAHDDEGVLPTRTEDGSWQYICPASHDGDGPYVIPTQHATWPTTANAHTGSGDAETDDLLDPLMKVFDCEDRWLEYGVVEYRLRQISPGVFARHVNEAHHHMFGDRRETASKNRFKTALTRLSAEGRLVREIRDSTGAAWTQTKRISYWARPAGATDQQDADVGAVLRSPRPLRRLDRRGPRRPHSPYDMTDVNTRLRLAQSWWLASELARRHPELLIIETHPGGGQYDCLSLVKDEQTLIDVNRVGSIHIHHDDGESIPIDSLCQQQEPYAVLKSVERRAGLRPPEQPRRTGPRGSVLADRGADPRLRDQLQGVDRCP